MYYFSSATSKTKCLLLAASILATIFVLPEDASGAEDSSKHPSDIGIMFVDSNPLDRSRSDVFPVADIILPVCSTSIIVNCLENVAIYKNGSSKVDAVFQGQAAGATLASKLEAGLPPVGEANLFTPAPDSGLPETQKYSVKLVEHLTYSESSKKYEHYNLAIFVQPYVIEQSKNFRSTSTYDWQKYAWSGDGEAGLITDFQKDVRVSVTVRLSKADGGWFSGRITDPIVQLKGESKFNSLTIDALPSTVPNIHAWTPVSQKTISMTKLGMVAGTSYAIESGFEDYPHTSSVDWTEQLRPFVQDKSTSEKTVWVVRSTYVQNPCFPNNRLSGFVATNAMAYSWNPPKFIDGFLDYKVGGMHFDSTGELTKGTYDLVLNSETARCLYKFTSAPISATVSIIGSSGESQSIATSVVSERDGFVKLSAYGFTFSSPTVRVKLQQKKTTQQAENLKTISCYKGKSSRKITAVKPVCPSGFKQR